MTSNALFQKYLEIYKGICEKARELFARLGIVFDLELTEKGGPAAIVANRVSIYYGNEAPDADVFLSDKLSNEELSTIRQAGKTYRCIAEDAELVIATGDVEAWFSNDRKKLVMRGVDFTDLLDHWRISGTAGGGMVLNLALKVLPQQDAEVSCIVDGVEMAEIVLGFLGFRTAEDQTVHLDLVPRREVVRVTTDDLEV